MALAILGVTGYTGDSSSRKRGVRDSTCGSSAGGATRSRSSRRPGEEVRVADARDRDALAAAFDGASVVASLAGPFLELGVQPVWAAIDAGAHYLDTTGEQEFVRLLHELVDEEYDVALLPAFGFDYVPGDLAARLAAEQVDGPLDEIVVAYSVKGVGTSRGTRRTIGHVMGQAQMAWEDGRLVDSRFGATTRTVRFPFGERTVVEWGGTEPLTVPRHTDVRNVRSYIRAPAVAARAGGLGRLAAPFVRLGSRFGPAGPVRGVAAEEPVHRRRRGARPGRGRPGGAHRQRRLRPHCASSPRRRAGAGGGRGARDGRARAGRGVRRAHARRQARAVPHDRGVMSSGPALTVRAMQRLRTLSEAECYARCYGWRGEDGVKVISVVSRIPRYETPVSGELLRALFEDKLDSREPEAA